MNKKLAVALLYLFLTIFVVEHFNSGAVLEAAAQTIPTRTPTPAPPTATSPNGGNSSPTATNTPGAANPTATSTLLPVNIAPTPVGGFLPTAVPCSSNPTIQTRGATNVRSGPGLEYDVIGELVYLEVRYIVGRAETSEWWLIQFNNGQFGWVSNDIVLVQGYTPIVPIVEAPPLNGSTPTPGALWNPTPIPFCTVTPIPTDTPPPIAESTQDVNAPATETPLPTELPPTEVLPTNTPIVQPTAVPLNPTATATAVPTETASESGGSGLIFIGLAVVVAFGLGAFFLRRR